MNSVFSYRLKELREARKMNMQELADRIGVSKSMISYYENNKKTPSLGTIDKIANVFDVSVDYLVGKTDSMGRDDPSKDVQLFIEKFKKLNPAQKEIIKNMVDALVD